MLLVSTFVVCVPGALAITLAAKIRFVIIAMQRSDDVTEVELEAKTEVLPLYNRFRLGFATASDLHELVDFLETLRVKDYHERAGRQLWRTKEYAAHLTSDHMAKLLYSLEQGIPTSSALGFHFTDMDSAKLILSSVGIRASSVGQLGGGVSICLAAREGTLQRFLPYM